jgi:hypothetical protein
MGRDPVSETYSFLVYKTVGKVQKGGNPNYFGRIVNTVCVCVCVCVEILKLGRGTPERHVMPQDLPVHGIVLLATAAPFD